MFIAINLLIINCTWISSSESQGLDENVCVEEYNDDELSDDANELQSSIP